MARLVKNMDLKEVQPLEGRRQYEMRCAIKRRDKQARGRRKDEFLKEFITEYESLYGI